MRIIIFLSSLIFSFQCTAEGFVSLEGKTKDGWEVLVGTEPPVAVYIWKDGKNRQSSEKTFSSEHCTYGSSGTMPSFSCDEKDKSPLAGTKYIGYRVESCDATYVYVCVSGCIKNRHAPLTLTQGFWEGDPYCGLSKKEIEEVERKNNEKEMAERKCWSRGRKDGGLLIHDTVKLRETDVKFRENPGVSGRVLRILPVETSVTILPLASTCEVVEGKLAKWVKVEIKDGSTIETGWIFDSSIKYADE